MEENIMKKIRLLLLPVITIVLEILPFGAVCVFASSPTERTRETFSYFSLVPYGYANFFPLITAILTCVLFILAMISIKKPNVKTAVFVLALIATIVSLLPLIYGVDYYSIVGCLITITLAIECFLAKIPVK
ncbi:MAG: hypothetical protein KBS62_03610 [Oscillospiraceae bacterium]|nr:hypothetical protein [Candidatus Ruminococcus equi]